MVTTFIIHHMNSTRETFVVTSTALINASCRRCIVEQ